MASATMAPATIAARLDRLPPSKYLFGLVARISAGGFFEFYDLFMTGYIAVGFVKAGLFKATTAGFFDINGLASFVGSGFAGMFVGTLLFSWVSDRFGRRTSFVVSLVWYSLATLVMAFMPDAGLIDFWRFVAGIGVGVQLITIDTYVSEITPKDARGTYIAWSQTIVFCAVPVVAVLSLLLVPHQFFGLDGWRYVAMLGAAGALFIGPIQRHICPSRRAGSKRTAVRAKATRS